ncbi:endothelin-converting enzyme homolog [Trichonephila clavata]|uniref:Endothelin-converting enzyme homolog n=1 Tax=Trichonephila clavata TaxID=2740835 RepID=A0A8X6GQT2_TRICU|nr:endothelin-converting enzyme homolog [Trichonephila clavata]
MYFLKLWIRHSLLLISPFEAWFSFNSSCIICMTEYQRVDLNEASDSKNMAIEDFDSPSAMNSRNGFSKTDGNLERELAGSKRNFWQRRSKMEKYLLAILIVLLLLVLILFIFSVIQEHDTDKKYCTTPACVKTAATILNTLDQSVDPCEDFHRYACGGWMKSNQLPDNQQIFSSYTKLIDDNKRIFRYVLEDESFELKGEAEKKARDFYRSCMNTSRIEKLGAEPLLNLLKKMGGWNISGEFNIKNWDFQKALELNNNYNNAHSLFFWTIMADFKNTTQNILLVNQNKLTLDSRDYYLNKTMDDKTISAYLAYMTKIGALLGGEENAARLQMQDVLEFEMKLAEIMIPKEEKSDHNKLYKKLTISQLQEVAPFINWMHLFNSAFMQVDQEIHSSEPVMVLALDYLKKLSKLVTQYLSNANGQVTIANYLAWILVHSKLSKLSKPFREAKESFIDDVSGAGKRWMFCVSEVEDSVGFALSAMFVREAFPGDSKIMAENMIQGIKESFKDNFPSLKWMDPETQKFAADKVDSIIDAVGYPDFILDPDQVDVAYEGLELNETDYFQNVMNSFHYIRALNWASLDFPSDRTAWGSYLPTFVNAYYGVTANVVALTAAILQPPFYDVSFPKSINFGSIGFFMGHELTHAFDNTGSLYDQYGNLNHWWKNSTVKNFKEQTQCLVEQYSNYEVQGIKVNGQLTLGENIADNGALKASFNAYQNWVARNHAEQPLPGLPFTSNQLFFVAFAQAWCEISTPEKESYFVLTNEHSPDRYRVIGTLSNSKDFAREFKCPLNSKMNPEKKCEVW